MKLGRVLRINKIIQFLNVDEDVKASMKLAKMVFFLVIYIHFYACIWWVLVKGGREWIPSKDMSTEDWYQVYDFTTDSQYLVCIFASVQSLLGNDL